MTETKKIKVPTQDVRLKWKSLDDIIAALGRDVVFELAMRQCDAADAARGWRQRNALRQKLVKARMEALAKSKGLSLEQYLSQELSVEAHRMADLDDDEETEAAG